MIDALYSSNSSQACQCPVSSVGGQKERKGKRTKASCVFYFFYIPRLLTEFVALISMTHCWRGNEKSESGLLKSCQIKEALLPVACWEISLKKKIMFFHSSARDYYGYANYL